MFQKPLTTDIRNRLITHDRTVRLPAFPIHTFSEPEPMRSPLRNFCALRVFESQFLFAVVASSTLGRVRLLRQMIQQLKELRRLADK